MNVLEISIDSEPVDYGRWRLYPIGDPHLDAAATDRKRLEQYIAHIAADPHAIWICVGDLLDGTSPHHRWFEVQAVDRDILLNMDKYVSYCLLELEAVFAPLRGIPGVMLQGNHDIRQGGTLWSGLAWELARRIGAQYGGDECLIRVSASTTQSRGNAITKIHAFHGAGGGLLPGGKLNRHIRDMSQLCDADIYVRGHVHDSMCRIQPIYSCNIKGKARLQTRYKAFITAPAFWPTRKEGLNNYASRKGYPPSDPGLVYLERHNPNGGCQTDGSRHDGKIYRKECPF